MKNFVKGVWRALLDKRSIIPGTPKNFYKHISEGYKPSNPYVLKNGIKWKYFKIQGNTIFASFYVPKTKKETRK